MISRQISKFVYLALVMIFIISPLSAIADGGVIRPLPNGDWTWADEKSQQAFINYENGIEKMIIAADIDEGNSDIAWIVPVPSNSNNIKLDISQELPVFVGDEVMSKAKINFDESLKNSYAAGLLGQVWTLPFSIMMFVSLGGSGSGGGSSNLISDNPISIDYHIEKSGMIAEVITAKNKQSVYDYLSQKGLNIKQGSISELDYYIEKNYSFVVSWIATKENYVKNKGERGIFISFPTKKIYYPLILTSVYGEAKIPVVVRVLDYVKPEIFPEIKPYTDTSYFTYRTKTLSGRSRANLAMCKPFMASMTASIISCYDENYPSSLWELMNNKKCGEEIKNDLEEIYKKCGGIPLYYSKDENDFTIIMQMSLSETMYKINSSGLTEIENSNGASYISPELKNFYGNKKPWAGEAEYTKITINAPAKLFTKDLQMEEGSPIHISFALWTVDNSQIVMLILYLLIVGIYSFIAGGIAGWIVYRKFREYAFIGLTNIFTLFGLILTHKYIKKKKGEDSRYSKSSFISFFSIIYVFLLIYSSMILMLMPGLSSSGTMTILYISIISMVSAAVIWVVLKFIESIFNKIGLKNKIIRILLIIIMSIILFIVINYMVYLLFLSLITKI